MSLSSTDAIISHLFTPSSCESSRDGRMYHTQIMLRSELRFSECMFCGCSSRARLEKSSTWVRLRGVSRSWTPLQFKGGDIALLDRFRGSIIKALCYPQRDWVKRGRLNNVVL